MGRPSADGLAVTKRCVVSVRMRIGVAPDALVPRTSRTSRFRLLHSIPKRAGCPASANIAKLRLVPSRYVQLPGVCGASRKLSYTGSSTKGGGGGAGRGVCCEAAGGKGAGSGAGVQQHRANTGNNAAAGSFLTTTSLNLFAAFAVSLPAHGGYRRSGLWQKSDVLIKCWWSAGLWKAAPGRRPW